MEARFPTLKAPLPVLAQVRNLRACIKVAIDFVSPESAAVCLELTRERRALTLAENAAGGHPDHAGPAPETRRHADKLQGAAMLAAAAAAYLPLLHPQPQA